MGYVAQITKYKTTAQIRNGNWVTEKEGNIESHFEENVQGILDNSPLTPNQQGVELTLKKFRGFNSREEGRLSKLASDPANEGKTFDMYKWVLTNISQK